MQFPFHTFLLGEIFLPTSTLTFLSLLILKPWDVAAVAHSGQARDILMHATTTLGALLHAETHFVL